MVDLGAPVSFVVLARGTPVYAGDGERVGKVAEVVADEERDIFDGIVVDRSMLPGGHRFVHADQIDEIYERGVRLRIDSAAARALPDWSGKRPWAPG